jgi:signal transduction histidine kinase
MTGGSAWATVAGVVRRFANAHGELVLVFGLGLLAQAELWIDHEWAADRYGLTPIALAMTAVLLLRTRAPLATLALETIGLQALASVNTVDNNDPMAMILIAIVAIYSTGAHTQGRALLAASLLVLAIITVTAVQDGSSLNVSGFLFFGFFIGGPFLAGIVIRIRRERERLLVRERDERARLAVAEERTRIARELHDIVAHAISVIVLQARGARHSLAEDRDDARHAIDAIERTASQALSEMRRLLAILRADDAATLAPQPSLHQLEVLAGEVRSAGLPVEVRMEGEPRELAPGLDASAYRIVQEALTNTLKHAGRARAVVTVRYGPETLEIEVADDGASVPNGDGGHGLVGMRERAAVFGGTIEAGYRHGSGYVVLARLPL